MIRDELFRSCVNKLNDKGFDNAYFEVKWIFQEALGNGNFEADLDKEITLAQRKYITDRIEKRSEGYPLQYILGEWEFYGLPFKVGEGVLIPRQDTETLIDIVKKKFGDKNELTVIDLCSGSGCIGITLEKILNCREVYLAEKSPRAFTYLKENIKLNNSKATAVLGDVLSAEVIDSLPDADVIACNPPYLTKEDMDNLQCEVSFEPGEALFGGEDGYDFYRSITRLWKNKLKEGAMIIYEIGIGQEDEVMAILRQQGFVNIRCHKDLCGVFRCVSGYIPVDDGSVAVKVDYDKAKGN